MVKEYLRAIPFLGNIFAVSATGRLGGGTSETAVVLEFRRTRISYYAENLGSPRAIHDLLPPSQSSRKFLGNGPT